ncbi:tripartite tricarboxylate transporter TctB family protein [Mameliella sediminis]|uniref:tripartite tricarboxylate transporter TctB family protein n=1 Tax=Mameliella sediminis TaxID=2836866 RepID=UPI001C454EE3|nr:tripartite tricarboxylate transporter TctB family protein [Mameliella sediminis]MBY6115572.1 tripartite tricarboxylate transporter TctB family protein [Antarctobacter heliothermus]MBY6145819.1 tripartite tricarboxylate transporter TctB family protein [Mameliella alba]MBV7393460.1 tripartite tricarboxylate transporter TctB family protein [Mameliella sediminis]MBY6161141.1 tripartite tricarboxylate transporter TctB family protein [Mameliella alba]MBY6169611.1 tripartite tricarboxylate transpo
MTQEDPRNKADDDDVDGGMSTAEDQIRGLGPFLMTSALFLASVALIVLTPNLTKAPPPNMGYHTHPAFFPMLCLIVIALSSGVVTLRCLLRSLPFSLREFASNLARYGTMPMLYSALYLGYFFVVPLIGYIPATVVFVAVTLAFAKMTLRQWLTGVIGLPIICFVAFVYFFEIWFPAPSLF